VDNQEIAEYFSRIADLLSIKGESSYRIMAYRRASESILSLSQDVEDLWREDALEDIPSVGDAISTKIDELLSTGKMSFYEKLIGEVPESLIDVLSVPDVGPKKAALFWEELGVTTVDELEEMARSEELRRLPGVGERSEEKILKNIEALKRRQTDRVSIGVARPLAEAFISRLMAMEEVKDAQFAGSLRRWRETVGDLDLVVGTNSPGEVGDAFLAFPEIADVRGRGETKISVELKDGMRAQLWLHPPERFGSALQYATGSQAHNIRLRELALDQGLSLSEHGFKKEDGSEILCAEESAVYTTLGLDWIPPEMREDRGELKAARSGGLPDLITEVDLKGEIHAHSDWSDGANTIEEMMEAAVDAGLQYLVITDHSQSLGIANGLSVDRLRRQRERIDSINEKTENQIRLLQGAEVEILADGQLDYPDDVLEGLDVVFASVHSSLRQSREKITRRFLSAIDNPRVDVIGHLTGRLIGRRDPSDLDVEAILKAAAEKGVALEINSHPDRLDLNDVHARRALDLGCLLAICTDAHRPEHFDHRMYGVGTARRAWATAESVINAWPVDRLLEWLNERG
jgi:DNA polymerase (family 10)